MKARVPGPPTHVLSAIPLRGLARSHAGLPRLSHRLVRVVPDRRNWDNAKMPRIGALTSNISLAATIAPTSPVRR
jgi:hypothetical protein